MYQRSEAEISFILRECKMQDIRKLGCPAKIFDEIVENRAAKIQDKIAEFRSKQPLAESTPAPTPLEQEISSAKLW